ncbi:MAG: RNA-directed DNA polymerase [bacterium]
MGKSGMPIGNLTSQIFANIYLNELDNFVQHTIRPQAYLRYGDDFIIIMENKEELGGARLQVEAFLLEQLGLRLNSKNDVIFKARKGIFFLGVEVFAKGRRLKKRNMHRATTRLKADNISSYRGLVHKHSNKRRKRFFDWILLERHDRERL